MADVIFDRVLGADLTEPGMIAGGLLSANVTALHSEPLGPLVLVQVEELLDVAQPIAPQRQPPSTWDGDDSDDEEGVTRGRASLKRCLRMRLTDGVAGAIAVEWQPVPAFDALTIKSKILIDGPLVRRGCVMLSSADVRGVFAAPAALSIEDGVEGSAQRAVADTGQPSTTSTT